MTLTNKQKIDLVRLGVPFEEIQEADQESCPHFESDLKNANQNSKHLNSDRLRIIEIITEAGRPVQARYIANMFSETMEVPAMEERLKKMIKYKLIKKFKGTIHGIPQKDGHYAFYELV